MAEERNIDKSLVAILRELYKQQSQSKTPTSDGFVLVVKESVWTRLFGEFFLKLEDLGGENRRLEHSGEEDDMLFYVRFQPGEREQQVLVYRRAAKNIPGLGDPHINWEESVYLNLILHELEYTVTCAVCCRLPSGDLKVSKKTSLKLYASPHMRRMDSKGEGTELSYPSIYFNIDTFDEVFKGLYVRDEEMVCVELVSCYKDGSDRAVIFLGSVKYEALKKVYDSKISLGAKMAQRFSFGLMPNQVDQTEFIRMRGPRGKGYAEMSINQYRPDPSDEPETRHREVHRSNSDTAIVRARTETSCRCSVSEDPEKDVKGHCAKCGQRMSGESSKPQNAAAKFFRPRRKSTMILSTRLTYISLPWSRIIQDITEVVQKPLFTK